MDVTRLDRRKLKSKKSRRRLKGFFDLAFTNADRVRRNKWKPSKAAQHVERRVSGRGITNEANLLMMVKRLVCEVCARGREQKKS